MSVSAGLAADELARRGRGRLLQVLGVAFGIAVGIGNTIGAGILRSPGTVASLLPSKLAFLLAWLAGGVYALLGVASLAELGVLLPQSGGQYVFARRAFGPYVGFVIGWSDWISSAAAIAAAAILIGEYTGAIFPRLAPAAVWIASAVVVAFTVVQLRGVRWGDVVQQLTSLLKGLAFVGLIAACLTLAPAGGPALDEGATGAAAATIGFGAIVLAMQSVIFAYDGWNGVLYFSGEVREPGRDIPRAMFGGVLAIIAIYVLVNIGFVHVLGMPALGRSEFAAGSAAAVIWGSSGDTIIRALLVVALTSGVNAILLFCSRILYAMSRDGLFARWGADVNLGGTPTTALLVSAALAIAFLVTGTFESVIAVAAFFFVLNYVTSFAAVFALRRSMPDAARPYRAWGYPWTTGFSLLCGIAFLVGAVVSDRRNSFIALGLLAISYPVYRLTVRARRLS